MNVCFLMREIKEVYLDRRVFEEYLRGVRGEENIIRILWMEKFIYNKIKIEKKIYFDNCSSIFISVLANLM